jgi:hypothetical protein
VVSKEKIFKQSKKQKKNMPVADMFDIGSHRNGQFSQRTYQGCLLPSFGSFGQAVLEKIFLEMNQSEKKLYVAAMFDNGSQRNE